MESMKLWYENVMGFAQTIQGVTLDIEMAKIYLAIWKGPLLTL